MVGCNLFSYTHNSLKEKAKSGLSPIGSWMDAYLPLIQIEMFSIDIDGLKDDASWRRLTVSLLDPPASDESLETMRFRLMERLRYATDEASVDK